jgi:hypothetical protein
VFFIDTLLKSQNHKHYITPDLRKDLASIVADIIKTQIEKIEPEGLSWEAIA